MFRVDESRDDVKPVAPVAPVANRAESAAYAIEYRRVTRRFADKRGKGMMTAVNEVSLAIHAGEVVSLIGPSGCGKSTLLNMGAGLYSPSEGEVLLGGRPVTGPSHDVAFMLQKDLLMPWRSIVSNVELGMQIRGVPRAERTARAMALLERCHLKGFESHHPRQLSGGMRQRAALARTLAVEPSVLLMDEPFAAVDAQTREILQFELLRIWEQKPTTMIFVTHSIEEAVLMGDRVFVLKGRPSAIAETITIDLPHPRTRATLRLPRFAELREQVWGTLMSEAREAEFHLEQ